MQSFGYLFENNQQPQKSGILSKVGKAALGLGGAAAIAGLGYGLGSGAINPQSIQNTWNSVKNTTSNLASQAADASKEKFNDVSNMVKAKTANFQSPGQSTKLAGADSQQSMLPKPSPTQIVNAATQKPVNDPTNIIKAPALQKDNIPPITPSPEYAQMNTQNVTNKWVTANTPAVRKLTGEQDNTPNPTFGR